jgi:hypothetical protein
VEAVPRAVVAYSPVELVVDGAAFVGGQHDVGHAHLCGPGFDGGDQGTPDGASAFVGGACDT